MTHQIHLFGGEVGGPGKTTVCSAAIAYLQGKERKFTIFDTDATKPDVYKAHKHLGCQLARFSESADLIDHANDIFNAALEQTVLVNLPANSFIALSQWFATNEIGLLAEEFDIQFTHFFVLDGSDASALLFKRSVTHFTTMRHVAVRNHGKTTLWDSFDQDAELQDLLTQFEVPVIDFPMFHGEKQRRIIAEKNLSLRQALSYESFDAIPRQRIRRFLRESAAAFESAEVFE